MSRFDSERQKLGMQPRSKSAMPEKSIFADERARLGSNGVQTYEYVDTSNLFSSPQEDAQHADSFTNPAPIPSEPSVWNGVIDNPIGRTAIHGLDLVGKGFDKASEVLGLDHVRGALQGLSNPSFQPDIQQEDNSYWGAYKNLFQNAGQALTSVGHSIAEGAANPERARQRFNENLTKATQEWDPVSRFAFNMEANTGTDPINFLPLDAAIVGGVKGVQKIGELTGLRTAVDNLGNTAVKGADKSSIFADERAQMGISQPNLRSTVDDFVSGLNKYAPEPTNARLVEDLNVIPDKSQTWADNFNRGQTEQTLGRYAPPQIDRYQKSFIQPEPTNLDDLLKVRGHNEATPENIAQVYNAKTWYHGTGTEGVTPESLYPFGTNHEGLFGQGVYLTDNPSIAQGYAKSRGKRTGTEAVYEANVKTDRVLDLEKPITPDVANTLKQTFGGLDNEFHDYDFNALVDDSLKHGETFERTFKKIQELIREHSVDNGWGKDEYMEHFQDFLVNMKKQGYDAVTHTGGSRTGHDPHRVLIMIDPNDMSETGRAGQVTRFQKFEGEIAPKARVNRESAPSKPFIKDDIKWTPKQSEGSIFAKERVQLAKNETATPSHMPVTEVPVNAPAMKQNLLTDLFGDQGVGISAVADTRRISKNPLTTTDQIVSNPLKKDIKGVKANVAATAKAAYQDFLDDLDPLKLFSKLEKEKTGAMLPLSKDPYESAIASRRANNIANVIVKDKFVTPEGQVLGEGLENTFKKVPRGKDREFLDYLVLRHAETRMARGEQVYDRSLNMTPEKVRADIERKEKLYPGFVNIAKEYDQFTDNMLKTYGVKEGIISPEAYQAMREQNPTYVPMRRQFSMSEKFANNKNYGVKPAFSGQKAPIKEVSPTGSVRRIVDPRRSLIEQTGAWVNSAMRNRVMQNIHELVQRDPEAWRGIAEIVPEHEVASASSMKQINKVLEEDGVEGLLESLNKDFELAFRKSGNQGLKDDNIVRVMVGGKPVHIRVQNPEAVKALIGLGPEQSNFVMDMFDAMSRATKFGATGALAPIFAVKSLSMDAIQSMIQSEKPVHQLWNMGHAILSQFADMLPKNTPVPVIESLRKLAQEYKLAGGEYSAALKGDRQLNKNISAMKRPPILSPQGVAKGVKGGIALPFKTMHKLSDVAENAPRMGAFKTVMQDAGWEKSRENVTKALRASQEVTTNFSRRGAQSRNIEKFIPYSNAAMQSLYRFTVSWKKNPIRTAAMVGGAVMLPKAIEYMQFHDDPDYQNLPAREKYRNLIVRKNNDGTFVKVPMPPEYNALGAFMVDSLRYFRDDDPKAFKGFSDAAANIFTPPLVSGAVQPLTQGGGAEQALSGVMNSTVLSPLTSVLSNRDYAGRPIESMSMSDRSPQNRYDERTSGPAKWLGDKLGMGPQKVDYLIRAYGGDPARLILPLTSQVGEGNVRNTLLKNFIVDPTFTNNLTNDFYQAKTLLSQAYRDNKEVGVPLPSWYDDSLRTQLSSTAKGSISTQISDLTGQKKSIGADNTISKEEKAAKLRDVQSRINKIYLDINSKVMEKKVPISNR